MYHAKHPEAARRPGYYTASGAFMGFGSEDESSENEDIERVSRDLDSTWVATQWNRSGISAGGS